MSLLQVYVSSHGCYTADFDQLLEVYGEQYVGIQASEVYLVQASANLYSLGWYV